MLGIEPGTSRTQSKCVISTPPESTESNGCRQAILLFRRNGLKGK